MLERIPLNHPLYEIAYAIIQSQFPPEEVRAEAMFHQDMLAGHCQFMAWVVEGHIQAVVTVWPLPDWIYIEHIAVDQAYQGQGIGREVMTYLLTEHSHSPFLLEVEIPTDLVTRRRVVFYERLGFHLNSYSYQQPSLGHGPAIDMKVMTYPQPLDEERFHQAVNQLKNRVYKID